MRTQTQMTRLITVAVLFAAAVCAQATQKKSDKTATTAPRATVLTVPKDAVKNADGTWNYTDKQGRKWVYVNTPFGIMKTDVTDAENKPAPPPNPATTPEVSTDWEFCSRYQVRTLSVPGLSEPSSCTV